MDSENLQQHDLEDGDSGRGYTNRNPDYNESSHPRDEAPEAISGETGYGAGAAGSIGQGSARTGISGAPGSTTETATDPGYASSNATDNATMSGGARQNDRADLRNAEDASRALGSSGEGARYSEANSTAAELANSDLGYASGYAGGSGTDEARGHETPADPEYGERQMGYEDDSNS